jgi:drug/metabolite transporter (DMT)-like permease/ribosomal protein S18 acetylase RimI-like enzyme
MTESHARTDTKAVAAAIATLVVWSSAFAGISVVVGPGGGYSAGAAVLLRFLVASATMVVAAVVTRMRMPKLADLPRIALAAIFGITIYHLAFTFGETEVSASAASLIIASGPIWTALMAVFFLRERFNAWGWAGVALAFSGVAAISFGEGKGLGLEPMALLVLLAAVSTAIYFVIGKKPLRTYSSLEFTSYVIWIGVLPMLVFLPDLLTRLPVAPASSTWTIVFLGVFPGALAYFLWSYALARMPASTTASFLYATPVLATFVAWVWQGVVPGFVTLAGGGLALAGVVLVQTKGRPKGVIAVVAATTPAQRMAVRELAMETMGNMARHLDLPADYFDEELSRFDEWYGGERGRAFVAYVDGVPAAGVVMRAWGDSDAELRRLYVRPAFRRRGLARALVRACVEEARALGYRRVVLVTSDEFEGASDLYTSEGFARIEPYRPVAARAALALARAL